MTNEGKDDVSMERNEVFSKGEELIYGIGMEKEQEWLSEGDKEIAGKEEIDVSRGLYDSVKVKESF